MIPRLATALARAAVGVLGSTWRVQTVGAQHPGCLRRDGRPFVFAVWHGHLLPLLWYHRGSDTTLVVSRHRDGQRLAAAAVAWGYRVIAGSSTRGGLTVLRCMIRILRGGGEIALTPDGPLGPREVAKPGAVAAAQQAGVPIVPVAASASSAWRLRSWDRFLVPKPFARIAIVYGEPVTVSEGRGDRGAEARRLQHRLDRVTALAEC